MSVPQILKTAMFDPTDDTVDAAALPDVSVGSALQGQGREGEKGRPMAAPATQSFCELFGFALGRI